MSKAFRKPNKGHHEHDKYKFGEFLYSDVCGPFRVRTKSGCRYFVTYICGKTRYAWVFLLKHKSEQASVFKNLVTNILPMYGVKVKNCLVTTGESILQKTSFYSATATVSRSCIPPPTLENRTAYVNVTTER